MPNSEAAGPLIGVKVLDFSMFIAGCYTAVQLGDLGATVIKVEPKYGDGARHWGPFLEGESRFFQAWNRNKRSIAVDMRSDEGLKIVHKLIEEADVLVENFRPGITTKLNMDYDTAKKINPKLIYCSITGFGTKGPFGKRPAYDPLLQTMGGTALANARTSGTVAISSVAISDYGAALLGSNGVLAALFHRERTGQGQLVETTLLQAVMTMQSHAFVKAHNTEEKPPFGIYPYRMFDTQEGHVFTAGGTDKFWCILCEELGKPELGTDPRYSSNPDRVKHADELNDILEPLFLAKTAKEWEEILVPMGFPLGRVMDYDEFYDLEQVDVMDMRTTTQHDIIGPLDLAGVPIHLSETPGAIQRSAPTLGQHNTEILTEIGYSKEEISDFQKNEVLS